MSLMSWLFSDKKRAPSKPGAGGGSGKSHKNHAKDPDGSGNGQSSKRKAERAARRELLYSVVREAMVRAGVLSASYKFKVLSLDSDGRQYLIMIDLAREAAGDPGHLAEIEALIVQSAKSRHEILVTAVYWRRNEQAGVARPGVRQPARAGDSQPMPLESQPAPLHSAPAPLAAAAGRRSAYEPIDADEVEAFKRALAAGSTAPAALAAGAKARASDSNGHHGPRSYTLLTGYEDTEMPEAENKSPLLSGTQYGDLR